MGVDEKDRRITKWNHNMEPTLKEILAKCEVKGFKAR
jgi:hypothetical protein